jgi:hypothetical protein
MNPRVKNVIPENNYMLHLWFTNGEEGVFDVKPYLDYEVFQALKDEKMFRTVRPFVGTIQWANEADLCPDTVYLDSVKIISEIVVKENIK